MKRMKHQVVVGEKGLRISQKKINDDVFITQFPNGLILVKNNVEILLTNEEVSSIFKEIKR